MLRFLAPLGPQVAEFSHGVEEGVAPVVFPVRTQVEVVLRFLHRVLDPPEVRLIQRLHLSHRLYDFHGLLLAFGHIIDEQRQLAMGVIELAAENV